MTEIDTPYINRQGREGTQRICGRQGMNQGS